MTYYFLLNNKHRKLSFLHKEQVTSIQYHTGDLTSTIRQDTKSYQNREVKLYRIYDKSPRNSEVNLAVLQDTTSNYKSQLYF